MPQQKPTVPPPGFTLLFNAQSTRLSKTSPFNAILLPIHWSIIRSNYRLISGPEILSESLPDDWQTNLIKKEEDDKHNIELFYKDVNSSEVIRVKVVEIEKGAVVAIHVSGEDGGSRGKDGDSGVLNVNDYLVKDDGSGYSVSGIYDVGSLWGLEEVVKGIVSGSGRVESPYASKLPPKKEEKTTSEERSRDDFSSLIAGDPASFRDPIRDIGRSDLDPFHGPLGGVGAPIGGMLMDPRGFRRPQLPQGIIPGSRFDPIGPPGGFGGFGQRGGRGGGSPINPRLPFSPEPDHMRAPGGYEDMFM